MPRLILVAIIINLVAAALTSLSLYHSRGRAEDQARLTAVNLATLAEINLSESARRIDLALLAIVDRLEHQLTWSRLTDAMVTDLLDTSLARLPEVDAFRAGETDGVVRWGKGVSSAQPATYADRPFFAAHRAAPGKHLIVTEPIFGRVSKKWVVAFTRSYRKPDGSFGGVVAPAVPLSFFDRLLAGMKLGPQGSAMIRHVDRGLLALQPPVDGPAGVVGDKTVGVTLAGLLDRGAQRASVQEASAFDGVVRNQAFQRVDGLPYVIGIGLAPRDYLESWHGEVLASGGLLSVLLLVSIFGVHLVNRAWKDRLAAADALVESESLYRHYIETAPEGIFVADSQGRYVDVNPAGCALVGYRREELLHMTILDLAPAGSVDEYIATFEGFKNERIGDAEFKLCHKDGRVLDVSLRSVVQPNGNVMGFCSDITARRQAEAQLASYRSNLENEVGLRTAELRAANRKLRDTEFAMNSVGIGIHWVDPESGRFIYVNRHAAEMLGYGADEMLKLSVADIDPNFSDQARARMRDELGLRGHLRIESTQRTRDGRRIPVEVSAFHHDGDEVSPPKLIVFVADIARRKEAERALLLAKEAAEAANVAKSAFLANMSHEIRTPLNAIVGMTHLLRRSPLTPAQLERLEKIENAGMHLLEIIESVLDLSKIEAGKLALEEADFDPAQLVREVAGMLQERAADKGLRLVVALDDLPRRLSGDATRLKQAMVNYVANALKFTARGQVLLRATAEKGAEAGVLLRFEVEDTGIGIDPAVTARLFSAFEQADNSMTRKYGGTGLGLAITRKLVEMMGGQVGVVSRPGEGSRFWFTVRLRRSADEGEPALAAPDVEDDLRRLRAAHAGRRILLAEDEPVNREIAESLLSDAGLLVDTAEDGEAAIDSVASKDYALILMDMQMPKLDGLAAARRIRQRYPAERLPIVAMTANAFEADRQACLAAGMDDFLSKPVDPRRLYATLLRWLDA
ncbi:MAG: PAS domain S-box protein [Sulfuritalea sp.]|nr:PAS domain S-box protein [Sulfuritalea sp.]